MKQQTLVVIGNGMVGHRFLEHIVDQDVAKHYRVVTFCEEPRAAYDRVGLTSFFAHRDAEKLMMARKEWYEQNEIDLHLGDRAATIDRKKRVVVSDQGRVMAYDKVVLATGSYPFVPPIPGVQHRGVFVYRTIEDLEKIIAYGKQAKSCAVIGGGLLGLEAAKAAFDLGLETHVVEFASRLMPRQIDDAGSNILVRQIESLGVSVHLGKATKAIQGDGKVEQLTFTSGGALDVDMIIVSCGIRPRDEIARECVLDVGERGGVIVNDLLQTSDSDIYAIGEVALHQGMIYGLVAPGYEMAQIVAHNLIEDMTPPTRSPDSVEDFNATENDGRLRFHGTALSAKLKLMGVDVASFGEYETEDDSVIALTFQDPIAGVYKKLFVNESGDKLLGGILVGDASDYGALVAIAKSTEPLPAGLLGGGQGGTLGSADTLSDDAQVCSCNNVSRGDICRAVCAAGLTTLDDIKNCTRAGTGCGGCMPLVTDIFNGEMKKTGVEIELRLCEHFGYTRQQLFDIVRIQGIKTFQELLDQHGTGNGCETCKPTVASILASLWNDTIIERDHATLQDTNDRFLANIQRGGLYSVVPRVPGGEITPDKLIALGTVAKKYGLYTKITGGQRVDLFGAQRQQLPDIWEELINAGFESGHAYGKAVRTVKSCVGSTWCRYGVQDSMGFAVRVEHRYRGIRAPHKIKFAVSGCIRECAEAQNKDVGMVATETGYNLFVCGNGGAKPRHADLLIGDVTEEEALRYIDRFLMFYIFTADKLTRTSVWLGKLTGGIDYVRDVVLHDSLGLCAELEERMQALVDSYQCEWKAVVNDPAKRELFRQFINTDETEPDIEFVDERGQTRPTDWPKTANELYQLTSFGTRANGEKRKQPTARSLHPQWVDVGNVSDFPADGGAAIRHGNVQIAVFNFQSRNEWYACQNMCPHMNAFVLSRGILGDIQGIPKVACPMHKKAFSLQSGDCLSDDQYKLKVFSVKVQQERVLVELPDPGQLDALLATDLHRVKECSSGECSACEPSEQAVSLGVT
jgi:NAD(P)H-dependent nitrite reductase large subunit/NAD(P)H-dependent nitrite reductase small subunit